jgi:hypothetical protein
LPVTDRGGPPGGGGIGRPEALVGAWAGAEGGVTGGALTVDGSAAAGAVAAGAVAAGATG